MNATVTERHDAKGFMHQIFSIVPLRIKRLVLLSSVAANYAGDTDDTRQAINKKFKLACETGALGLPMHYNESIWGAPNKEKPLHPEYYTSRIPEWLKYGTDALMYTEIRQIMNSLSN